MVIGEKIHLQTSKDEDMSPCFYQVWWALLLNHKNTSFFFFAVLVTKSSDWLQNILYSKRPETVFFIFPHNPVYMFRDPWVLINRTWVQLVHSRDTYNSPRWVLDSPLLVGHFWTFWWVPTIVRI
jgi:hypothetical protein